MGLKQLFPEFKHYEPYAQRIENLTRDEFEAIVHEPPLDEWKVSEKDATALAEWLDGRRRLLRPAVEEFLKR